MGYFKDIVEGISTTVTGMNITLKQWMTPTAAKEMPTLQYPTEKWVTPPGYRGMLFNYVEDCIVCKQCAVACPVDCIRIEGEAAPKDIDLGKCTNGTAKKIFLDRYDIDMTKCLYCGLCTEACPTECLVMTSEYEYATYDRDSQNYRFARVREMQIAGRKEIKPAAAPAAPAAEAPKAEPPKPEVPPAH